jgi:hypothetical protein
MGIPARSNVKEGGCTTLRVRDTPNANTHVPLPATKQRFKAEDLNR